MVTKIEWTNETWNPVVGCSKVSAGCENCYAERMAYRQVNMGNEYYQMVMDGKHWNGTTAITPAMEKPIHWHKPRMIFVCSMSDLFHETVPDKWIDEVMDVAKIANQHTYQILTKRAKRMAEYFSTREVASNVWVGVTAENQEQVIKRVPYLLQIGAPVRFVSVEPMLGTVDLTRIVLEKAESPERGEPDCSFNALEGWIMGCEEWRTKLHWVICGGESGPGARPMNPDWVRGLRDQCQEYGVPLFFKQWGEYFPDHRQFRSEEQWCGKAKTWLTRQSVCMDTNGMILKNGGDFSNAKYPVTIMHRVGKKEAGHELDGREWREFPEVRGE